MNIESRTIYCADNLDILRGIDSETVDLIYLDPPFNKNETFVGSNARTQDIKEFFLNLQEEKGVFKDEDFEAVFKGAPNFDDVWGDTDVKREHYSQIDAYNNELVNYFDSVRKSAQSGTFYYLIFMTIRLIEMRRILKPTGSLYLHCDQTMSHYLKVILDKIFGHENFRNEIVWRYGKMENATVNYPRNNNVILFYSKSDKYTFNVLKGGESEYKERWSKFVRKNRIHYGDVKHKNDKMLQSRIDKVIEENQGEISDDTVLYDFDKEFKSLSNNWYIPIIKGNAKQKTGYPTQKPLALLERIIKVSSKEGDMVLDPFCGCATTCIAAQRLERQWIGIDWKKIAYYMVYWRADQEGLGTVARVQGKFWDDYIKLSTDPPTRTDANSAESFYAVKTKDELKTYKIPESKHMNPQYKKEAIETLYQEQRGICNGCDIFKRKVELTVDHIVPWDVSKDNSIDNLQLLCYLCNVWKGTGNMTKLISKLHEEEVITEGTYKKQLQRYEAEGS